MKPIDGRGSPPFRKRAIRIMRRFLLVAFEETRDPANDRAGQPAGESAFGLPAASGLAVLEKRRLMAPDALAGAELTKLPPAH
jgi:hypothetical protein